MNPDITLPKPKFVRVYTALLTQTGTDAPTVVVLQNTLGADVVWTRQSAGIYKGTCTGKFIEGKTAMYAQYTWNNAITSILDFTYPDSISVNTSVLSGGVYTATDDLLLNTMVEIRVYE